MKDGRRVSGGRDPALPPSVVAFVSKVEDLGGLTGGSALERPRWSGFGSQRL